jgi:hypothetical protein
VRTHSLNALAIMVCLLILAGIPAFARGSPEAGLKQVETLIAAKDYAQAQKLLVELRRRNPDLVDPTQELFDLIMAQERSYNAVRRTLGESLDRGDIEAVETLITQLEQMNPHKSLAVEKRELRDLLAARGVGIYMDTVAVLLQEGKYAEALEAYAAAIEDPAVAGFTAQRDIFFASKISPISIAAVQGSGASLVAAGRKAAAVEGAVRVLAQAVSALLGGSLGDGKAAEAARLAGPLRTLAGLQAETAKFVETLAAVEAMLRTQGSIESDRYTQYILDLARGRADKVEGILGAIRLLWEHGADQAVGAAVESASASFDEALRTYDEASRSRDPADLVRSESAFQSAGARNLFAVELGKIISSPGWQITADNADSLRSKRALAMASQESADESAAFRALITLQRSAAGLPAAVPGSTQARRSAQELTVRADALTAEWKDRSRRWTLQDPSSGLDLSGLSKAALQMSERFAAFAAEARLLDLSHALALARAESNGFSGRLAAAVARRREGEDLLNGTRDGRPPADPNEIVQRLPARAQEAFVAAGTALDGLSRSVSSWKSRWTADLPFVVQSEGMRSLVAEADGLRAGIDALAVELAALRGRAEDSLFTADRNRREAEAAFAQAEKELSRKEYERARASAGDDAAGLFLASLALEENAQARNRLEKDIPALLTRIEQTIYAQNVRDVDALIDKAVVHFKATKYLDARVELDKARAKWEQMAEGKKRKYETLEYWYALVLNAIAVSGSRSLAANDPRLDVVSPLMSRARELYAEAEVLTAEADKLRRADARNPAIAQLMARRADLLSQAAERVGSVLAVASKYGEAVVLQLRIRKLSDVGTFRKEAEEGVRTILVGIGGSPRTIKADEAYNQLTQYLELVDDRALRASIERALAGLAQELNIGEKQVTQEQQAQVTAFVAEARNRFKPDNKDTYEGTLVLLDRALAIDSTSKAARALRQEVLIRMGSPAVGIPSREDQRIFAEAQNLLNSGGEQNERQSWALIQPLLARYTDFQPLRKLEATLKARLGL